MTNFFKKPWLIAIAFFTLGVFSGVGISQHQISNSITKADESGQCQCDCKCKP